MDDNLVYAGFCGLFVAATAGGYLFFVRYWQHKTRPLRAGRLVLGNVLVLFFLAAVVGLLGESDHRFRVRHHGFVRSEQGLPTLVHTVLTTSTTWGCATTRTTGSPSRRARAGLPSLGIPFTVGHGVRDVNDRFANQVRRARPEWDVQVFAQPGLDSGDELSILARLANAHYEFDQVVLVYCLNDLDDVTPEWVERYRMINERLRQQRPSFLFEHSYLLNMLYYRSWMVMLPEIRDYYRCDREAYDGPPWQAHTPRLRAMRGPGAVSGEGDYSSSPFPFCTSSVRRTSSATSIGNSTTSGAASTCLTWICCQSMSRIPAQAHRERLRRPSE